MIQVVNFEVYKEHYLMTKMTKKTLELTIEYVPYHLYKKNHATYIICISNQEESELLKWVNDNKIDHDKVIVLSHHKHYLFKHWRAVNFLDKDVDYETLCRWLMVIVQKHGLSCLYQDYLLTSGVLKKGADEEKMSTRLKKYLDSDPSNIVCLFIKEKNRVLVQDEERMYQYYLKGISDSYDYLIVKKTTS